MDSTSGSSGLASMPKGGAAAPLGISGVSTVGALNSLRNEASWLGNGNTCTLNSTHNTDNTCSLIIEDENKALAEQRREGHSQWRWQMQETLEARVRLEEERQQLRLEEQEQLRKEEQERRAAREREETRVQQEVNRVTLLLTGTCISDYQNKVKAMPLN